MVTESLLPKNPPITFGCHGILRDYLGFLAFFLAQARRATVSRGGQIKYANLHIREPSPPICKSIAARLLSCSCRPLPAPSCAIDSISPSEQWDFITALDTAPPNIVKVAHHRNGALVAVSLVPTSENTGIVGLVISDNRHPIGPTTANFDKKNPRRGAEMPHFWRIYWGCLTDS